MDDFTDLLQFRIGDLPVLPGRLMVMRDKQATALQLRMNAALILLAEEGCQIVCSERTPNTICRTPVYDDDPIQKASSGLRKVIGDVRRKPRCIETVTRPGYRLIASAYFPETQSRT
jgi:DNA-binding winged helix-turn-helix (wHTH) protein